MRRASYALVVVLMASCATSSADSDADGGVDVPVGCGDGVVDADEECDDGRSADGDGCSSACAVETGWTCAGEPSTCTPICGDGLVVEEECDDGAADPDDGCSSDCALEDGWACSGQPSTCVPVVVCPVPTTVVDTDGALLSSCKAYRDAGFVGNGAYAIDTDADGPLEPVLVLCDMETDGGGWTIVVNNDNADAEPSACQPRVATTAAFACGTLACDQDFSLRVDGLAFSEVVWAAYQGELAVESYTYMTFDAQKSFPVDDGTWSFSADNINQTITDWMDKPKFYCGWTPSIIGFRRLANEFPFQSTGGYASNNVVTFIDEDNDNNDPGRMSFTDASTGTGSTTGLDDFQDGHGCEELWSPQANRGFSSFIMVR